MRHTQELKMSQSEANVLAMTSDAFLVEEVAHLKEQVESRN